MEDLTKTKHAVEFDTKMALLLIYTNFYSPKDMNFAIKEYKIMALAANVVVGELVPMIELSISISKFSGIFNYISKKEHFKSFSF